MANVLNAIISLLFKSHFKVTMWKQFVFTCLPRAMYSSFLEFAYICTIGIIAQLESALCILSKNRLGMAAAAHSSIIISWPCHWIMWLWLKSKAARRRRLLPLLGGGEQTITGEHECHTTKKLVLHNVEDGAERHSKSCSWWKNCCSSLESTRDTCMYIADCQCTRKRNWMLIAALLGALHRTLHK